MSVGIGAYQFIDKFSSLRINQIQVYRKKIPLRQKSNVSSIGTDYWREICSIIIFYDCFSNISWPGFTLDFRPETSNCSIFPLDRD